MAGVAALTIAATTDKGATRWEYSVELQYFKHAEPEYAKIHTTQLNTLASQGWEVVCSHYDSSGKYRRHTRDCFEARKEIVVDEIVEVPDGVRSRSGPRRQK